MIRSSDPSSKSLEEVVTDHGGPCDSVTPGPDSVFRSLLVEKKITTARWVSCLGVPFPWGGHKLRGHYLTGWCF